MMMTICGCDWEVNGCRRALRRTHLLPWLFLALRGALIPTLGWVIRRSYFLRRSTTPRIWFYRKVWYFEPKRKN